MKMWIAEEFMIPSSHSSTSSQHYDVMCWHVWCSVPLVIYLQEVLTLTSKAGVEKTSTSTGNTSTATSSWCARPHGVCSTCGTRSTAPTSFPRTSTACACSPKPWTRPRTASWGCCSSGTRSRLTSASRSSGKTPTPRRVEDAEFSRHQNGRSEWKCIRFERKMWRLFTFRGLKTVPSAVALERTKGRSRTCTSAIINGPLLDRSPISDISAVIYRPFVYSSVTHANMESTLEP